MTATIPPTPPTPAPAPAPAPAPTSGVRWPFIVGAVLGWVFIGVGIRGALHESAATRPFELVKWLAGLLLAHDLVLAPLAYGVGWLTTRRRGLGPVQLALAVTVVVGAIVFPLVRAYGKRADNATLLPLHYTRNLVVTLAVVWALALALTGARALRRRTPPEGRQ